MPLQRFLTSLRAPVATIALAFAAATLAADSGAPELEEKAVLGHIERVTLMPEGIAAEARLDTGASRSSLHARDVETFERDGEDWVRFTFDDHEGGEHAMEKRLVEEIRITQASGQEKRYTVVIGMCVGERYAEPAFTLSDRSNLTYPILVGRDFLSDRILVSSTREYVNEPDCDE